MVENVEQGSSFLLECFHTAHEELLVRIKQREDWLKLGLATQVVILATMNGFEILGAKPGVGSAAGVGPSQWLPLISPPVALIFVLLYNIEERMIGHLAGYLRDLPELERRIVNSQDKIDTFRSSRHLMESFRGTLLYRLGSNLLLFVLLPVLVTFLPDQHMPANHTASLDLTDYVRWVVDMPICLATLVIVILSWNYRRRVKNYAITKQPRPHNTVGQADG